MYTALNEYGKSRVAYGRLFLQMHDAREHVEQRKLEEIGQYVNLLTGEDELTRHLDILVG